MRISGPESVVGDIASAVASVDVSGASSNISTYSDIHLYDADGDEISTSNLTLNMNSVRVTVTILPVKTVPVQFQVGGTPASGYMRNDYVSVEPQTVDIAGRNTVLSGVERILIHAEAVDITGADGDFTQTVNIADYLPEGTTISGTDYDGTVTITVGVEAVQNVSLEADRSAILLTDIPEGYTAKLTMVSDGFTTLNENSAGVLRFELSGLARNVTGLRLSDILAQIDVADAIADSAARTDLSGTYDAVVSVTLPEGVTMRNTLSAQVTLESIE